MRLSVEDPQKLNKDKGMVSNRKHTKIQNFYDQRMESANKEGKHIKIHDETNDTGDMVNVNEGTQSPATNNII